MGVLPNDEIAGYSALGELSLDGAVARVTGVLPAAVDAAAHDLGLICPSQQGAEAAWAGDLSIGVLSLDGAVATPNLGLPPISSGPALKLEFGAG